MKILIIGAGPAGVNCAYWASKDGHEVEIYEMRNNLAIKPCGEGVFNEAFDYVPIKPNESKWALNYIDKTEIFYENLSILQAETKPYDGYIINKREFLHELLNLAKEEGSKVFLNQRVEEIKEENYDLIIDAGGYISTFARKKAFKYNDYKLAPALRGYGETNKIREDTIYINFFKYGYAWIFPYGKNYCNFGIGGHVTSKELLLNKLYKFLKIFDVKIKGKIEGASFPSNGPLKELKRGKIVIAGDTAGMVMPTSGEGIRFALFAGKNCYKENYEKIFWEKYGERLIVGKKLLEFWMNLEDEEMINIIKTLKPKTLIEAFLEGKKPSIIEGLKLIKEPEIVVKALKKVYI